MLRTEDFPTPFSQHHHKTPDDNFRIGVAQRSHDLVGRFPVRAQQRAPYFSAARFLSKGRRGASESQTHRGKDAGAASGRWNASHGLYPRLEYSMVTPVADRAPAN